MMKTENQKGFKRGELFVVASGRNKGISMLAADLILSAGLKGASGGNCNVTACQKPGANYFNKSNRKYYCAACAREINWPGGRADTMALYGVPLLCEIQTPQ